MEINYTRPSEVVLSRELIDKCDDLKQLAQWLRDLQVLAEEVETHIVVRKKFGPPPPNAVAKLTFVRVAENWVTRRLRTLNGHSSNADNNRQVELARLNELVVSLRRQLEEARETADARKIALLVHAAGGFIRVSEKHAQVVPSLRLTRTEEPATGDYIFATEFAE